MTVAAVGIAVLLAGCGGSDEGAQATSSPEPSTATSAATSPEGESELEGTWQTSPIFHSDMEAALRRYGLAKWVDEFRPLLPLMPFADESVLILDLQDGEWDLYGQAKGGPRDEIDYNAEYVVKGDTVEKTHSTGVTTYRWSVDGDTLTIEWLETTEPPSEGVPDQVFGTALYMTEEFKRQD